MLPKGVHALFAAEPFGSGGGLRARNSGRAASAWATAAARDRGAPGLGGDHAEEPIVAPLAGGDGRGGHDDDFAQRGGFGENARGTASVKSGRVGKENNVGLRQQGKVIRGGERAFGQTDPIDAKTIQALQTKGPKARRLRSASGRFWT